MFAYKRNNFILDIGFYYTNIPWPQSKMINSFFSFLYANLLNQKQNKNNKTRVRNTCFYINNFNNVSLTFQNNNNFKHIISFLIFLSFNLTPQSWTWIYSFWKWSYQWSFSFSWSQNLWWICLSIVSLIISTNWYTI